MKSFYSIFIVIMLIITIMWTMSNFGAEISGNSNLDAQSQLLIIDVTNELEQNYNPNSSFDASTSTLSGNGTFDGEDVFALEYLDGKSQAEIQENRVASISKLPDLALRSSGLPEESVNVYRLIIALILTVMLAFAGYRAFFGGGKVTDN